MKSKKKYLLLSIIVLLIALFGIYFGLIKDNNNDKQTRKEIADFKFLLVKVLVIDKNTTPDNINLDSIFKGDKYLRSILYNSTQNILLTKENDNYVVDLDDNVNSKVLKNVIDHQFALNDNNGNVIKDCTYDEKTNKIIIPKTYFKNEKTLEPVQMELVSRLTEKELRNLPVKVSIKNVFDTNKTITLMGDRDSTNISLFKYKKASNIKKSDLTVYVNKENSDGKIDSNFYNFKSKTGDLKLQTPPVFLNKLIVKVNANVFKKISNMAFMDVEALVASDEGPYIVDLIEKPTGLTAKTWYATNNVDIKYGDEMDSSIRANLPYAWVIKDYAASGGNTGISTISNSNWWSVIEDKTPKNQSFNWSDWFGPDSFNGEDYSSGHNVGYTEIPTEFYKLKENGNATNINDYTTLASTLETVDNDNVGHLSMTCIHIGDAANSSSGEHALWAYVFYLDTGDEGEMDVVFTTAENINSQTLFAIARYKWTTPEMIPGGGESDKGYIKITKTYSPAVTNPKTAEFTAWKTTSGKCTNADYKNSSITKIKSKWYESANAYVIGYNTEGTKNYAELDLGMYCIVENKTGVQTISYYPSWTNFFRDSDNHRIYYKKVRISKASPQPTGKETVTIGSGDSAVTINQYKVDVNVRNEAPCLTIVKVDAEDSNSQTNPIPGMIFDLYQYTGDQTDASASIATCLTNNNCTSTTKVGTNNPVSTGTATTNSEGIAVFKGLRTGVSYYAVEVGATPGTKAVDYYDNSTGITAAKVHKVKINEGTDASLTLCKKNTIANYKNYYCMKVKKVSEEDSNKILPGASFKTTINGTEVTKADADDGNNDGYTTFFTENATGPFTITETVAPAKYDLPTTAISTTASLSTGEVFKLTSNQSYAAAQSECLNADATKVSTVVASDKETISVINWFKTVEDKQTLAPGAKFKVKKTGTNDYVTVSGTKPVTINGVTKTCHIFTGFNSTGTEITDTTGDNCITFLDPGSYTVIETNPTKYHVFGNKNEHTYTAGKQFATLNPNDDGTSDTSNKFVNKPTYFEFTKTVSGNDPFTNLTTQELRRLTFYIYDSNGNKVKFGTTASGIYEYLNNDVDNLTVSSTVEALHVDDTRKIRVQHLPVGTYTIKEAGATLNADGTCDCEGDGSECIGFYAPKYTSTNASEYTFTIGTCSGVGTCKNSDNTPSSEPQCLNGGMTATNQCSTVSVVSKTLNNTPTELNFTKKDLYSYEDASDVVDFENDQERSDFDRIKFRVTDKNGNPLRLVRLDNHGTCKTDDSYAEYRYFPSYISDAQIIALGYTPITDGIVYTCGGHIKITHLCRGQKYYIEEIEVPEDSVFTLPDNESDRKKEYTIPCCDVPVQDKPSHTTIINDKGTRVRFEKRDSKYNYLIPDETTTFEVYRCPKVDGEFKDCNLSEYASVDPSTGKYVLDQNRLAQANIKQIKFAPRRVITGDEEDPMPTDAESKYEVYTAMSDSDLQNSTNYVTEVHPDHGVLVLRYMQAGYKYVLFETKAPKNYSLPSKENAQTKFTVKTKLSEVTITDAPNTPTSLIIRKYDENSNLLPGAQFKIYVGDTTCNPNLSAMNQPKTELRLKTIRDGVYEARPVTDTSVIQTCSDENGTCSLIPSNEVTALTYTNYLGTWANFTNTLNDKNEIIEIKQGEALVQYLEYGHCYIIEEVKAPKGYSLPKKESDRFTMVNIEENTKYASDTDKALINAPTPFTFYKYDEYGKPLDGAEFKLQKLDDNKKYQDLTVSLDTEKEQSGELFYKVDSTSDNKVITTKDGKATVFYLEPGQYRIIETKPAEGKELGKNPNVATFFVDDSGNVYGNSIIVNKSKTDILQILSSSSAEFILSPRTGVTVIKYGLIIAVLVALIAGLMILRKKSK